MDDIRPVRPSRRPLQPPMRATQQAIIPKPTLDLLPEPRHELLLPAQSPSLRIRRRKWLWLIVGFIICAIVVGTAIAAILWYSDGLKPRSSVVSRTLVTVSSGETADLIGKELQQKGVIRSAAVFSLYAKQSGKLNNLKAGTYLFSPTQSVQEIVQWLFEGKVDTFNLTIIPGKTLAAIKEALINDGFSTANIDAAFAQTYSSPLFNDKPATATLEGYIFPDTYTITSQTTVQQLLELAFNNFYTHIQAEGLPAALAAKGFNLHQAITLASIIGQEANTPEDRRQVAQVFEKRLRIGMMLGSDVTYMYAAKLLGVTPSPDLDSPYNTRKYTGLPPGPIANFSLDALEAVANPAPGDYLYFVAGDNGKLYFANTEAEHQQNIAKYCKSLCQ